MHRFVSQQLLEPEEFLLDEKTGGLPERTQEDPAVPAEKRGIE
jgi:hypothetical protein